MAATRKAIPQRQSTGMMGGATAIVAGVLSALAALAALVLAQPVCGALPPCGAEGLAAGAACLAPGALCLPAGAHFVANAIVVLAGPGGVGAVVLGHLVRRRRRAKGAAPDHVHPEAPIA
jgi:hypothetical protein